jgi:hypothetical protein
MPPASSPDPGAGVGAGARVVQGRDRDVFCADCVGADAVLIGSDSVESIGSRTAYELDRNALRVQNILGILTEATL